MVSVWTLVLIGFFLFFKQLYFLEYVSRLVLLFHKKVKEFLKHQGWFNEQKMMNFPEQKKYDDENCMQLNYNWKWKCVWLFLCMQICTRISLYTHVYTRHTIQHNKHAVCVRTYFISVLRFLIHSCLIKLNHTPDTTISFFSCLFFTLHISRQL